MLMCVNLYNFAQTFSECIHRTLALFPAISSRTVVNVHRSQQITDIQRKLGFHDTSRLAFHDTSGSSINVSFSQRQKFLRVQTAAIGFQSFSSVIHSTLRLPSSIPSSRLVWGSPSHLSLPFHYNHVTNPPSKHLISFAKELGLTRPN